MKIKNVASTKWATTLRRTSPKFARSFPAVAPRCRQRKSWGPQILRRSRRRWRRAGRRRLRFSRDALVKMCFCFCIHFFSFIKRNRSEQDGVRESIHPPYLCCAQELARRCFCNQGISADGLNPLTVSQTPSENSNRAIGRTPIPVST